MGIHTDIFIPMKNHRNHPIIFHLNFIFINKNMALIIHDYFFQILCNYETIL